MEPDGALRVLFLIGDAAPHLERGPPYTVTMRRAVEKGITIVPVGCSGLDDTGEFVWRQLAAFTLGRFAFVSYGGTADVHVDAFPMNDLDDILARAVIREVEALHGGRRDSRRRWRSRGGTQAPRRLRLLAPAAPAASLRGSRPRPGLRRVGVATVSRATAKA